MWILLPRLGSSTLNLSLSIPSWTETVDWAGCLIPLFLFQHGVISTPSFYLSANLESKRDEYYERLRGISRAGDWEGLGHILSSSCNRTSHGKQDYGEKIMDLHGEMKTLVPTMTRSAHATMALDLLLSSTDFSARAKIPKATVARLLKVLEHEGVIALTRAGQGREAGIYAFTRLLKIIS